MAGWGATRYGGRDSQHLLSIGLNLMDVDFCKMHSFYDSHILQADELCAGLPPTEESSFNSYDERVITGEKDSCQGLELRKIIKRVMVKVDGSTSTRSFTYHHFTSITLILHQHFKYPT